MNASPWRVEHVYGQPTPGHVFVSHASEDAGLANSLCELLESHGLRCWIAPRDVRPGYNYGEEIVHGIERCYALLLLLSPDSNVSNAVASEVEQAFSAAKHIVPVRLTQLEPARTLRFFLGARQWIDATREPRSDALIQLVPTLAALQGSAAEPSSSMRGQVRAAKPQDVHLRLAIVSLCIGLVVAIMISLALVRLEPPRSWVLIRGGSAQLGQSRPEAWRAVQATIDTKEFDAVFASRVRTASLGPYFIDRWEVTNGEYQGFMNACARSRQCPDADLDFSYVPDALSKPVQRRTWAEASLYCSWAHGRLPSAAEWEHAARGEKAAFFPWGDNPHVEGDWATIRDVGTRRADTSPFGVQDMAGNVAEWVNDEVACSEDEAGAVCRTLKGIGAIRYRASGLRFFKHAGAVPMFYEFPMERDARLDGVGFRCAHDVHAMHAIVPQWKALAGTTALMGCLLAAALYLAPRLQRRLEVLDARRGRTTPPPSY